MNAEIKDFFFLLLLINLVHSVYKFRKIPNTISESPPKSPHIACILFDQQSKT